MTDDLGLEFEAGAAHYRAFVGPPEDYDLIAAMTFGLLTALGLRQQHKLLDVGCGSLRVGRLLIPYLNVGNYIGIEPNRWLVDEGIAREIGNDLVEIKQPRFHYSDSAKSLPEDSFDFALAQSIFSHTGVDLLDRWLHELSGVLKPTGLLVATFHTGEEDSQKNGWIYPDCVRYKVATMTANARKHGFSLRLLDWRHPRQAWALFVKPQFDASWFDHRPLTWNTWLDHTLKKSL